MSVYVVRDKSSSPGQFHLNDHVGYASTGCRYGTVELPPRPTKKAARDSGVD